MTTLDDRIADVVRFDRTYHDPELWVRLEPRLFEEAQRTRDALCGPPQPDYPSYREKLGYLRGLEWVLRESEDLTRKERD